MSEFRQKPSTKEWVIIATERAKRPDDFVEEHDEESEELPEYDPECPFCPGNEDQTPPDVHHQTMGGDWTLRVVPNKFAALQDDFPPERERDDIFLKANGFGIAEVVIETPAHDKTIATMETLEVERVLRAYRSRYLDLIKMEDINFVTIFRNYGPLAGTSLEHPHSQIIATPIIPPHVRNPISQTMNYFDSYGTCVYCDVIEKELKRGERIIFETDFFAVMSPFAARSPFETRIRPKEHKASFGDISDREIIDLAEVLQKTMKKIYVGLGNPNYNYIIRSAPYGDEDARYLHWYILIIPKLTTPAGFEISSGIYINTSSPEECSEYLRDVEV